MIQEKIKKKIEQSKALITIAKLIGFQVKSLQDQQKELLEKAEELGNECEQLFLELERDHQ